MSRRHPHTRGCFMLLSGLAGFLACAAQGGTKEAAQKTHLNWAREIVRGLHPEDTSYRHKNSSVRWKGIEGVTRYESHADCSGFLNALLARAYGLTGEGFEQWLGTRRPLAKTYYDAIIEK